VIGEKGTQLFSRPDAKVVAERRKDIGGVGRPQDGFLTEQAVDKLRV